MVLPVRLSILRKEDKQLLFTVSVDIRTLTDSGEIDCFFF